MANDIAIWTKYIMNYTNDVRQISIVSLVCSISYSYICHCHVFLMDISDLKSKYSFKWNGLFPLPSYLHGIELLNTMDDISSDSSTGLLLYDTPGSALVGSFDFI
eukprot:486377_1